MKKTVITCPQGDTLITVTESFFVTKKTYVTVPIQYRAFIYVDDISLYRLGPCTDRSLASSFGNEIIGKQVKLAFVLWKNIDHTYWQIDDYKMDEKSNTSPYMNARGSIRLEVVNYPRLISVFAEKNVITEEDVKKKVTLAVTNIISPILAEKHLSNGSEYSVSLISEELEAILCDELILASLGVRINEFEMTSLSFDLKK